MLFVDFAVDAQGLPTREEAAAAYLEDGDRLVREPPQPPHHARGWMVVTQDDEVRAVLGFTPVRDGYLVGSVDECAG